MIVCAMPCLANSSVHACAQNTSTCPSNNRPLSLVDITLHVMIRCLPFLSFPSFPMDGFERRPGFLRTKDLCKGLAALTFAFLSSALLVCARVFAMRCGLLSPIPENSCLLPTETFRVLSGW